MSVCNNCKDKDTCLMVGKKDKCDIKAFNLLKERVIEHFDGFCPEALGYEIEYKDIKKCGEIDCKDCWREVIG